MDTPKTRIHTLAKKLDLSEGYGALLYLTALMEADPVLVAENEEEGLSWEGHLDGLNAALCCLVIHEQHREPEAAVEIVDSLLNQARVILQEPGGGQP